MGALDRVFRGRRPAQQRSAEAIVAGLWRNGEQGVWYDPSDLSTMFQDATGTTPVYMPGQGQPDCWIGLQLDKRFGLLRGPERIANGDFSAGLAGWTAGAGVTESTGAVQFTGVASGVGITQAAATPYVAGVWYRVTLTIADYVGGPVLAVRLGGAGAFFTVTAGAGPKTLTIQAGGPSTSAVFVAVSSGGATYKIDDISVRELPGNHRWQGTATSRPVLSARYNLITYSDQFDAAAWTKVECSIDPNVVVGPNGGLADKLIPSTAALSHYITCLAGTATESRTAYVVVKAAGCSKVTLWPGGSATFAHYDLAAGTVSKEANVISLSITPLGDGWCVLRATWAVLSLTHLRIYSSQGPQGSALTAGDGVAGLLVERADIRAANDGVGLPEYQRVVDPNTYDTVGFPFYRKPDGVDDWMQTANVDFSGTDKVTMAAALRKLSDASIGVFLELSPVYTNPSTFAIFAPAVNAGTELSLGLNGGVQSSQLLYRAMSFPAPMTTVVTAALNTAGASQEGQIAGRFNGAPMAATAWSKGSRTDPGNLGNYPLYFDRRGGTTYSFNGRDYGTMIVGRLLTAFETAAVEKYLRLKSKAY